MRVKTHQFARSGFGVLCAVALSLPAAAEEAADEASDTVKLQDIVVESEAARSVYAGYSTTGSKTTTPLNETPQAISVITGDWMELQNIQSVEEALRYAAGVKTSPYGNDPRNDTFFIRGFNQSTGGLFRDGLRTVTGVYGNWRTEPFGLERVEVLRGPSSVLYGQNSPGGLVNQMSKRPSSREAYTFKAEYGSYDSLQAAFDATGGLNDDDTLLYRAVAVVRKADAQVDYVDNARQYIAPSLTWKPREDMIWTVLMDYQHDDLGKANAYPTEGTLLPNPNGQIPTTRFVGDPNFDDFVRDQTSVTSLFTWNLSDAMTLRQNLSLANLKVDYQTLNPGVLQDDDRTVSRTAVVADEDTDSIAVDTNLEGHWTTGAVEHTVLMGADFRRTDLDYMEGSGSAPSLDLYDPVYNVDVTRPPFTTFAQQRSDQFGVYLQDSAKIADRFVISLAGRYDTVEQTTDYQFLDTASGVYTPYYEEADQDDWTWRAGAVWLTDWGGAPYVSYSTSFTPLSGVDAYGNPFDPETGKQYEVGFKFQPIGEDISIMVALFDLRRQNVQTADPNDPTNTLQSGEVTSKGIEVETSYSIGGLNLVASGAYMDIEITESNNGDEGLMPFGVPEVFGSAWAHYKFDLGALAGLSVGGGVRYVGASKDFTNTVEAPSSTLFDVMLGYEVNNWRLAVNGTNIFDKEYVSAVYSATTYAYYGNRRYVIASLQYAF